MLYFPLKNLIVGFDAQSNFPSSVEPKFKIHLIKSTLRKKMSKAKGQNEPLYYSELRFDNAYCQISSSHSFLLKNPPQILRILDWCYFQACSTLGSVLLGLNVNEQ